MKKCTWLPDQKINKMTNVKVNSFKKKYLKKPIKNLLFLIFFSFFLFFPLFEQYSKPFLAKPPLAWPPINVRETVASPVSRQETAIS